MKKKIILRVITGISLVLTGLITSRAMFTNAANDFDGEGSELKPYIITNAEQLQKVGNYCGKDYKETYFKIEVEGNKLDMKGENFTPICSMIDGANEEEVFKDAFYGHFDGNNTELINFKIETDKFFGGLFGATNGAEISNIGIGENSTITVNGKAKSGISPTGGIVGEAWETNLTNVWNKAVVKGNGSNVGGIVGRLIQSSTIKKATNNGEVKAGVANNKDSVTGGIVGYASDNITIEDVSNSASITGDGSRVGGIVGNLQGYKESRNTKGKSILKKATNNGEVKAGVDNNKISIAGGVVGYASNNIIIEDVSNSASITGDSSHVGGIVGELQNYYDDSDTKDIAILKKATNNGEVKAGVDNDKNSWAGGIVGIAYEVTIEDVSNSASITGAGGFVGGIAGEIKTNSTAKNIVNYNQNIKGSEKVGLLIGIMPNDSANTAKNAYTLKENTTLNGVGYYNENDIIENMKGLTSEELKNKDNFVGFDFENVWEMGSNYPVLKPFEVIEETVSETGYSKTNLIIQFDGNPINADNYLYKDRTYVDLEAFCKDSKICTVTNEGNNYTITRKQKINNDSKKEISHVVEHKSGSDVFKSSIIIANRKIHDDENTYNKSDVKSCPSEITDPNYSCVAGKFFVPIRFLTQALGLRVEWDGEKQTVSILDKLIESFNSKYTEVITKGKCDDNINNCKVKKNSDGNYELSKNEEYYFRTIDNNGKIVKFKKLLSFYNIIEKDGTKQPYSYTSGAFTISSIEIKTGNKADKKDIAQIVIYRISEQDDDYKKENFNVGSYPILINDTFVIK